MFPVKSIDHAISMTSDEGTLARLRTYGAYSAIVGHDCLLTKGGWIVPKCSTRTGFRLAQLLRTRHDKTHGCLEHRIETR